MSKFLDQRFRSLVPYTPGEQPKIDNLIKLNTNESPFPPSPKAIKRAEEELKRLQLYPDPECLFLRQKIAERVTEGLGADSVFVGNGSDEVLYLAFMACKDRGFVFPDITYGFYPVYAEINGAKYRQIPLKEDFSVDVEELKKADETIVLANPNAPTGMTVKKEEIVSLVRSRPDRLVIVDEAYVDFGGDSCVDLVKEFDNLLVVQTFSKSRSLAGARLGFGIAEKSIIADLTLLKFSINPYNINRTTLALGVGVLDDPEYTKANCATIIKNREYTREKLTELGFTVLPSSSNFLFASHGRIGGKEVYSYLREKGILIRYFDKDRLKNFVRITIGSFEQMKILTEAVEKMTEEL